jgi:hypothetical protein
MFGGRNYAEYTGEMDIVPLEFLSGPLFRTDLTWPATSLDTRGVLGSIWP